MLDLLNIGEVRLLTNNPLKVEGLEQAGIKVSERLPLATKATPHNAHYLPTKRDRTGPQLSPPSTLPARPVRRLSVVPPSPARLAGPELARPSPHRRATGAPPSPSG